MFCYVKSCPLGLDLGVPFAAKTVVYQMFGGIMEVLRIIITIIQVLCAIGLVAIVMLQTGKDGLSGVITGATDSFMAKNKNVGKEAMLAKLTKIVAAVFLVLTFALNLI